MSSSSKNGLLLVAHGSKMAESNKEINDLAQKLKDQDGMWVEACFMEFAQPTIPQKLMDAHFAGLSSLKILPCFVSAGVHVKKDLFSLIDQAKKEYPSMNIEVMPHLGALPGLPDLILKSL